MEIGFDVFLSHSSADKPSVEVIAERLASEGLRPFLDKWHLLAGMPWQDELATAMANSASVAVFIGPSGSGPWHHEEMRVALDRAARTQDDFRVIPVLLPGADASAVDGFLSQRTWVDFAAGLDDAGALARLAAGIRGEAFSDDSFELPDEPAPYRGLVRFEAADASMFFGRDDETATLIDKVKGSSFVAVVGASGSGKSSLVRAGLVPQLHRLQPVVSGGWVTMVCTPGVDPFRRLAEQVVQLVPSGVSRLDEVDRLVERFAGRDDGLITALGVYTADGPRPVLVVIDQFEELLTLAGSATPQRELAARFVANLATAAADQAGMVKLVVTLRADFVAAALSVDGLAELLQDNQVMLGALTGARLREAIVRPAEQVGALFEKGLVSRIVDDVDDEPGALPLLQHALYELWNHRRGPWLTIDAYEATGGVVGALSTSADTVYRRLPPAQQDVARRVFIRLTTLGDGVPDTRRRATRGELYPAGGDRHDVDAVVAALSGQQARLIVVEQDSVEVAHEALLRSWDTLRGWLEEDRDALRVHRRLSQDAGEWANEHNRDAAALYRGGRLEEATNFAETHAGELNDTESEFLQTSTAHAANELEQAHQRARQLRRRLTAALAAFVLALAGVIGAALQWRQATEAKNEAEQLAVKATARALAAGSEQALVDDPGLAALLALESTRSAPTPEAVRAMNGVISSSWNQTLTTNSTPLAMFNHDGTRIVTAGDDGVVVWDVDGTKLTTLTTDIAFSAVFNHDGTRIVTTSDDGVVVWDVDGTQLTTLTTALPSSAMFNHDGTRIVTAGGDGVVVWDVDGTQLTTLTTALAISAMFNHDGTRIVTAGGDGVDVWDVDGARLTTLTANYAFSAVFNDDGTGIVTTGGDEVVVWDVDGTQLTTLPTALATSAVFNHDGTRIVTTGGDGVDVWDVDGTQLTTLPTSLATSAVFNHDGTRIVTAGGDGAVVWDVDGTQLTTLTADASSAVFNHDGTRIVTTGVDGAVVWDVDGTQLTTLTTNYASSAVFNHDGTRIVTAGVDGVVVWDVDGTQLTTLTDVAASAVFNHDGTRIVTAGVDGVVVWDVYGSQLTTLTTNYAFSAGFNHDGTRIVTAGGDGAVVWDVDGTQLTTLTAVASSAVFNHDGTRFVTAGVNGVVVWDVDGSQLTTLTTNDADSAAFNHDGTSIVTRNRDEVVVWDVDGTQLTILTTIYADSAAFNHDGTRVVTASDDGVKVWQVRDADELKAELARRLGPRQFDQSECAAYQIDPCPTA